MEEIKEKMNQPKTVRKNRQSGRESSYCDVLEAKGGSVSGQGMFSRMAMMIFLKCS